MWVYRPVTSYLDGLGVEIKLRASRTLGKCFTPEDNLSSDPPTYTYQMHCHAQLLLHLGHT